MNTFIQLISIIAIIFILDHQSAMADHSSAEAQAQPIEHASISSVQHPEERPNDYELSGDGTGDETGHQKRILSGRTDRPLLSGKDKPDRKQSVGDTILEKLHLKQPDNRQRRTSVDDISPPVPGSGRRASQDQAFTIGGAKAGRVTENAIEEDESDDGAKERKTERSSSFGKVFGRRSSMNERRTTKDLEARDGPNTLYRCRDW